MSIISDQTKRKIKNLHDFYSLMHQAVLEGHSQSGAAASRHEKIIFAHNCMSFILPQHATSVESWSKASTMYKLVKYRFQCLTLEG